MLEKLLYPRSVALPRIVILILWGLYFLAFYLLYNQIGLAAVSLALFPVAADGWYFGSLAGIVISAVMVIVHSLALMASGSSPLGMLTPSDLVVGFVLLVVGGITGFLGRLVRQHRADILELRKLEEERQGRLRFQSLLNEITWAALDAEDVGAMSRIVTDGIIKLFGADGCYLASWDETRQSLFPLAAHGAGSGVYPSVRFEIGEPTLAGRILSAGSPLVIKDFANSPYRGMVSAKMSFLISNVNTMLGLPLVMGGKKLGIVFLTYRQPHEFSEDEIRQGELASHQIAIALARVQSFEIAGRRIKELKVLNEIAVASTQVESEDKLLELATEIIGQNLFPDNFGILLLDEKSGTLRAHPSYRVYDLTNLDPLDFVVSLGRGISGQVAQSGKPQRVGNVRQAENYFDVDSRTRSELCVPLKVKERVLGVINAESAELNAFTPNDESLLMTFAGQLATAIEYLRTLDAEHHWMDRLVRSNELTSALSSLAAKIERMVSPAEVIKTLQQEFQEMGLKSMLSLYMVESDQMVFQYAPLLSALGDVAARDAFGYRVRAGKMESLFGIENVLAPVVLPDPIQTMRIILNGYPESAVSSALHAADVTRETEIIHLPLLLEDHLLGALWLWGQNVTEADLPVMAIFAKQVAITLENARLFEETQNLALTDHLTGLYNRRGLFEIGKIEFARSHRAGRPFSAIMADLDHFKKVNDGYGHFTGDLVLQNLASSCRKSVRDVDLVGRYGGEEIVILLPETDLQTAVNVAERLRQAVANNPLQIADEIEIEVTASLGVAQLDENTPNLDTLIARADQAMYIAKHKGRNRVAVST
ncbi:MAG: diguanylate cyclase [Chloroflexi bacterium]|nr:diguanylate cyclase [Chloroflexota bacterium]